MAQQPHILSQSKKRSFACYPVAILTIVMNDKDQVLLLSHPDRADMWEVVNGGLEDNETPLDCVFRECREELGPKVKIHPINTLHAQSFAYDEAIPKMLSIIFLAAYEGGSIKPGDDMTGSLYQWVNITDILSGKVNVIVPNGQVWLFERAATMYQLWHTKAVDLQIDLSPENNIKKK